MYGEPGLAKWSLAGSESVAHREERIIHKAYANANDYHVEMQSFVVRKRYAPTAQPL